ncbi:hypothetical protein [[Flexibacter] sp. ATCC 35208]|uniref:hypothetical protein n=1 Tax=[Flexibacter] sp. ATCC 35208 TaxID=1936242 RepID=UPI00117F170A|nr:hypothetical protein [[Flexibacter] sp. ATCC 35208]
MITAYHRIASDNIDLPVDITMDFSQGADGMPEMEKEARFKYYNTPPKGIFAALVGSNPNMRQFVSS